MIKQDTYENQVKTVYLGVGSNLGNKKYNIESVKYELQNYNINILKCSGYYETKSWPDPKKPKFINIVIMIKTKFSAIKLLKICNQIEVKLGRIRTAKKNTPRTCDIDILDFNKKNFMRSNPMLILPHPELSKRNFVLLPLYEIARSWIHPKSKVNIKKLIDSLTIEDLRSIKQI